MISGIKYENESREIHSSTTIADENDNNNIFYNCPECPSLIEILSIDEENNNIEYNCINKRYFHGKNIISIKEYLSKMRKFSSEKINTDLCHIHSSKNNNNEYVSYCFDCNCHLCNECLKTRTHINHIKNNIIEIKPMKEELKIIEEVIKDYKINLDKLKKEKYTEDKIIENEVNKTKIIEEEKYEKIMQQNKKKEKEEMWLNKKQYMNDIETIKKKYEEEIKIKKSLYKENIKLITNKYKSIYEKASIRYNTKIERLTKKYKQQIQKIDLDNKLEKVSCMKSLIEVVYNTYCAFNNNYFNAININKILLHYYNNEYINDTIMKRTLKENYDGALQKILQKRNEDMTYIKQRKDYDYEEKIII